MPRPDRNVLPEWTPGTVAILSTVGEGPHAIPVSTGLRASDELVLLALAARRRTLEHLRSEPRVALTILAEGDTAITAHSIAAVVADPMRISDRVCAVALSVERIQDHGQPRFEIESGVKWSWTDPEAEDRDRLVRAELAEIASTLAPDGPG